MPNLKPVPTEVIDQLITTALDTTVKKYGFSRTNSIESGIGVSNIFCENNENAKKVIQEIGVFISKNLANFVEDKTGEDAKQYNRSVTLFESKLNEDENTGVLQISWRKR